MIEAEKNIIRFIAMFGAAVWVLFLTITWYRNSGENRALSQLIDCCSTTLGLSLPKFNFLKSSVVSEPTVAKQTWCLSVDTYRRRVEHIYWFGQNIWHREHKRSLKNLGSITVHSPLQHDALRSQVKLGQRWREIHSFTHWLESAQPETSTRTKENLKTADGWATYIMLPLCPPRTLKL